MNFTADQHSRGIRVVAVPADVAKSAFDTLCREIATDGWTRLMANPCQRLYLVGEDVAGIWDHLKLVNDDYAGDDCYVLQENFPGNLELEQCVVWIRERLSRTPLVCIRDSY